jgi:excisionase family DNA binding protein
MTEKSPQNSVQRLLSPEEVANILQLKPDTIRILLRTGKLRGIKIGKVWRVRVQDLEEFIQAREITVP